MPRRRNTEPDPEPVPLTSDEAGAFTGWYVGAEEPELEADSDERDPQSAIDELAEELFREYHSQYPPKP